MNGNVDSPTQSAPVGWGAHYYINLDRSVERDALIKSRWASSMLVRFPAISKDNLLAYVPTHTSPGDYCRQNGVREGELALTLGYNHLLNLHPNENLTVLEDDADPKLSRLALFDVIHKLRTLREQELFEGVFMQRIVLPRQYPPLVSNAYLVPALTASYNGHHHALPLHSTTRGLAGAGAIAWTAAGISRFLERHSSADGNFACPKDAPCALDLDINRQLGLASIFPPLVEQSMMRSASSIRDGDGEALRGHILVHMQSYASNALAALWAYETASFLTATYMSRSIDMNRSTDDIYQAVQRHLLEDKEFAALVTQRFVSPQWRVKSLGYERQWTDNEATVVQLLRIGLALLVASLFTLISWGPVKMKRE